MTGLSTFPRQGLLSGELNLSVLAFSGFGCRWPKISLERVGRQGLGCVGNKDVYEPAVDRQSQGSPEGWAKAGDGESRD